MLKTFRIIFFCSIFIFISGCSQADIEGKANDVGNVVGRLLKGAGDGLVEGLSGEEKK